MKFETKAPKVPYTVRLRKEQIESLKKISKKYSKPGSYVSVNEIIEKAIEELVKKV